MQELYPHKGRSGRPCGSVGYRQIVMDLVMPSQIKAYEYTYVLLKQTTERWITTQLGLAHSRR